MGQERKEDYHEKAIMKALEKEKARSAWKKGVILYAAADY